MSFGCFAVNFELLSAFPIALSIDRSFGEHPRFSIAAIGLLFDSLGGGHVDGLPSRSRTGKRLRMKRRRVLFPASGGGFIISATAIARAFNWAVTAFRKKLISVQTFFMRPIGWVRSRWREFLEASARTQSVFVAAFVFFGCRPGTRLLVRMNSSFSFEQAAKFVEHFRSRRPQVGASTGIGRATGSDFVDIAAIRAGHHCPRPWAGVGRGLSASHTTVLDTDLCSVR